MKNLSKNLLGPVQVVILAVVIAALGSFAYAAWQEPGCAPTGCNAEAPINTSSSPQIKTGGLTVAWGTGMTNGLLVAHGNVGIDTLTPSEALEVSGNVKATAFFYSSDKNLKKNITPLSDSLSKIMQLQGVSFNLKADNSSNIGLIAQDVEKVYPQIVHTDNASGLKSVEYGNLVAPLIEAVKAQQKEIDQLKAEINQLKSAK